MPASAANATPATVRDRDAAEIVTHTAPTQGILMPTPIFRTILSSLFMTVLALRADAGVLRDAVQKRMEAKAAAVSEQPGTLFDLPFGTHPRQTLDVYLPEAPRNAPVVVMVHGGGWKLGDKRSEAVVQNKRARWTPRGVIFVSVNYRLLPDARPLEQADDVADALAYVQRHAAEWGGDPEKIVLMGHSAGAHLVSLISADPSHYPQLKAWLGTVSLDSAAMNIPAAMERDHLDLYDEAFGSDPALWEAVSPYHRLTRSAPPMMLVCSTKRADAPCREIGGFVAKAESLGLRVDVQPEALSHRGINRLLGSEERYTEAVEGFMRSVGMEF